MSPPEKINPDKVSERTLTRYLYSPEMRDVDLFIRTGGEQRTSNFLMWESAYAELYFCDTFWPDFKAEELCKAICDFQKRERRFGKTSEQI